MASLDSDAVQSIVDGTWAYFKEFKDPAVRAHRIYLHLYELRNSDDPTFSSSSEIAAAEHYYYARQLVSYEGYPVSEAKLLVFGYDAFKRVKFAIKDNELVQTYAPEGFLDWLEKLGRHDPNKPMRAPSDELKSWGIRGCDDGEADRAKSKISPSPEWKKPPNYSGTRH